MISNEHKELHDSLQAMYDRAQQAKNPINCFPALSEFAEQLVKNPLLRPHLDLVLEQAKPHFVPFSDAKRRCFDEINVIRTTLFAYQSVLPDLAIHLEACNELERSRAPGSGDLIEDLYKTLIGAHALIAADKSADHTRMLKQLRFGAKSSSYENIFAPAWHEFHVQAKIIDRKKKNSLWGSALALRDLWTFYDLEIRPGRQQELLKNNQGWAAYFFDFDAQRFDKALEQSQPQESPSLGFDVETYQMHLHRVWKFLDPRLLVEVEVYASVVRTQSTLATPCPTYDGATGMLVVNSIGVEFKRTSLRGKMLELLFPGGIPLQEWISSDVIYDEAIKSEADSAWDVLDNSARDDAKKRIYEAYEGINERVEKSVKKTNFLKAMGAAFCVNYQHLPANKLQKLAE